MRHRVKPGDEAIGRHKCLLVVRHLTMVALRQHHVASAFQRRPVERDVGGRAPTADPHAVGLRVLVVVVRADRHPLHTGRRLVAGAALGQVERGEEGPRAVELVVGQVARDRPHAVIRRAAEDGVRHRVQAAAVLDVGTDRIAAARIAHQHDLLLAGGLEHAATAAASARIWSSVELRPSCGLVSSSRAVGYGMLTATRRSRGQPLLSKRHRVVSHNAAESPLPCTKTIGG